MSQSQPHHSDDTAPAPSSPTSTSHPAAGPSTPSQDVARLESDLLPSPTASEPRRPVSDAYSNVDGSARVYRFPNELPPRFAGDRGEPAPNERTVTVRDLRNKTCWICSEEEEDTASASASLSGMAAARRRRFVHPCNCTLVAHEGCLLRWIDQSNRDHPLQKSVTCPQCKAPYVVLNNKSALLRLFDSVDRLVTLAQPIGAVALLGGSVLVACTTYGCVAMRMFLGKHAARRALASPWPWHYWIDIPLIPFALFASRLNIFDSAMTWVPTLAAFPLTGLPMITATAAHGRLFERYLESSVFGNRAYPPGPALTVLLMPWVRVFYLALKRRVYRAVLQPFYRRNDTSANPGSTGRRRRRVVIVGEPDSYLLDSDPDLGTPAPLEGTDEPTMELRIAHQGRTGTAANDVTETVYVTHRSLTRVFFGALAMPFIANLMGRLLARLARSSPTLARFLGIRGIYDGTSSSLLRSYYTTTSTPTPTKTSADAAAPSPMAALFRGSLPGVDSDYRTKGSSDERTFRDRLGLLGHAQRYDDLDPVWFRNAVGAGAFVVLKDAASLLYRYLRLSQRSRTTIKDLPFQAGLVSSLDLRD